jgi:hypothetical protein
MQWQDKITKVVRRVAKDLIANDETEISEVVRRRLFEDLGSEKIRKNVAKPTATGASSGARSSRPSGPPWTRLRPRPRLGSSSSGRFETCYPFHPATLSVFQRKWQALPQYQQTRGTLAMLAQWISMGAYRTLPKGPHGAAHHARIGAARRARSSAAWSSASWGVAPGRRHRHRHRRRQAHARRSTPTPRGRCGTSTGASAPRSSSSRRADRSTRSPTCRSCASPSASRTVDTTSIDNAAFALEDKSYFIRKVGSDGFKIGYQPTMKKVVSDRRASLDEETEVKPAMRKLVEEEFRRGASVPWFHSRRRRRDPGHATTDAGGGRSGGGVVGQAALCARRSPSGPPARKVAAPLSGRARLVPQEAGPRPPREGRAMARLEASGAEVAEGTLGGEFDRRPGGHPVEGEGRRGGRQGRGLGRLSVRGDRRQPGAGRAEGDRPRRGAFEQRRDPVRARHHRAEVEALLNESVGAGYIDRNWPPALKESGAWPLASLRQSFLNGSLTRLVDPDAILKEQDRRVRQRGDFGLASGKEGRRNYERVVVQGACRAGRGRLRGRSCSCCRKGRALLPCQQEVRGD